MTEELKEYAVAGLHADLLSRLSEVPRDAKVLDLGCGTGAWLRRLAGAGFTRLTGADRVAPPSEAFDAPRPDFLEVNLEAPGVALADVRGTCDLVTAIEVVEHVSNQGTFWDVVASSLKPGGRALVTTPNLLSLPSRLRWVLSGRLRQFEDGDPTHVTPIFLPLLPRVLEPRQLRLGGHWTFPRRGYLTMRPALRVLSQPLAFADRYPGDTLCFWVHKGPRPR